MVYLGQNCASHTVEIKLLLTGLHIKKRLSHTETEEMQKCICTALHSSSVHRGMSKKGR